MAFCRNCGAEISDQAYVCPKCGVLVKENEQKAVDDSGSAGWAVLGFFFPIVGLILYLVWKDDKPNSSKQAGKGALISVIVYGAFLLIYILIFIIAISSAVNAVSLLSLI